MLMTEIITWRGILASENSVCPRHGHRLCSGAGGGMWTAGLYVLRVRIRGRELEMGCRGEADSKKTTIPH